MRHKALLVSLTPALLAFASAAVAQTGIVTGQILDPAGAVVRDATITATSTVTGLSRTVTSSSAGVYNLAALPPSRYDIVVTAPGFQPTTRTGVTLTVAATLPLNITLSVAGTNTSVDVSGSSSNAVETNSFQLSTVIDSRQINDLPLILRDPYQLVLLSPGVVTATNNTGGFSVNGQRDRNNNFLLDGVDNNDTSVPGIQGGISSANPDSAQEFRVITNNFDAEFGRNTGAIIDVITRSGTNDFHGDAYEFGRYNALGARDYFNKKADGKQDPYVRNDFGVSVGGPLWKDHTFFFLNGEVQRFSTTRTESQIVPTAAYKSGNFTFIDPTDGSRTPVNLTGGTGNQTGLGPDTGVGKILGVVPNGQADNGDGVTATYFFPSGDNLNGYQLTGRLDQKLTDKHQLTVRYNYGHSAESDPFHDETIPGYGQTAVIATNHNGVVSIASALSANTTNLFHAGYNQNNAGFFCSHAAIDALLGTDSFGIGRDITFPGLFNGSAFGCNSIGDSNAQARLSSTLTLSDTYSITKAAHSIKFGGEFRSVKDSSYDNFYSREQLTLDQYSNTGVDAYTFNGNQNSPSYTNFQDLVYARVGAVATVNENQFFTRAGIRRANDLTRFQQHEFAVFAQDTWKVSPRLTLIYGLRYAYNGVPYEKDGNFSNFYGDASAPLPAVGYFSFTPVGPGTGRQLYADSWRMFEPRVGFSFDPLGDGKTAIRGGFGIFHDRIFDNVFGNAKSNPPFQANYFATPFDNTAETTVANISYPGNLTPSARIDNNNFLNAPVVIDPNLKMPTTESYNIGAQHQFGGTTVQVNYVGNHSLHGLREINGAPPQAALVQASLAAGVLPAALQRLALYTGGTDANGKNFGPRVNNTAFHDELFQTSIVSGNYNALQAQVSGRIGGLTLTGSYTYAHSLDNGSDPILPGAGNSSLPRNSSDLGPEYGSSDFDVRHRGTVAASYNLPLGLCKSTLRSGFFGHFLEGIQLSGIQQVQAGLPFDLHGTVDNLHTSLNNRPQLVGSPYPSNRGTRVAAGVAQGPARAAFANAPFGQSVSIHRNKFYGPGYVNTDVVFQKTQTIYERCKLVFRAESYNVLNHPNFASPPFANLVISSANFGVSTAQVGQNDGTTGARQIQGGVKLIF